MSAKKTLALCLVAAALIGILSTSATAGLLDGAAYYDGTTTWKGSTNFSSAYNPNLYGKIDWIVYDRGQFPYAPSSGYTPTAGEYVYAYQVYSFGTEDISNFSVFMDNMADNIGTFSAAGVTGVAPSYYELASNEYASWDFSSFVKQNPANPPSQGLVYSSNYSPKNFHGITFDGGAYAWVVPVPSPSDVAIPEPSTTILLGVGLGLAGLVRLFRRR